MGAADIKRVQFVGSASLLLSAMSSHQEKSSETVLPIPDVTVLTDGKDEVDLEAVERVAAAKLVRDLAAAKRRNERIAQKKQERADLLRKQKEDEDVREAQRKLDEAAKAREKVPVAPPVCYSFCLLKKLEIDLLSRLSRWLRLRARRRGHPNVR